LTRSKAVTELKWKRHGGDNYYKTSNNQPGLPVATQRWHTGRKTVASSWLFVAAKVWHLQQLLLGCETWTINEMVTQGTKEQNGNNQPAMCCSGAEMALELTVAR